jgi:hypothetical protein
MGRRPRNDHKEWTPEHHEMLRQMAEENLPVSFICKKLGRAEKAVRMRATKLGISLKPPSRKRPGLLRSQLGKTT